jgi:K+-sensing histidine kinase KdpD
LAAVTISATLKNIRNPDQVSVAVSGRAMEMILGQLIENAQKFHPNHSPNLVIGIDQVPQGIRLQICDDGLTLPDDHLSKIWTPYYQAEKYFTGQVKGVGLGLSMVAAIILGVGGACRAYNRADETSDGEAGLVIELIIPAMPATGKSQSAGDQS